MRKVLLFFVVLLMIVSNIKAQGCLPNNPIDWQETFSNYQTTTMKPDCWTLFDCGNRVKVDNSIVQDSHGGVLYLYSSRQHNCQNAIAVSPEFSGSLNGSELSLWIRKEDGYKITMLMY